jgi:hypothetical protein
MKAHLKRTVPRDLRTPADDQEARDRQMAAMLGNLAAARDRVSEVTFIVEEDYTTRGRSRTRGRILQPIESFANLLWSAYSKEPNMVELAPWLLNAGIVDKETNKTFLTTEVLEKALAQGNCPVPIDNIWLARSIVLFSALIPDEERHSLLALGSRKGCAPITEAYFGITDVQTERDQPTDIDTVTSGGPRRPRLSLPPSTNETTRTPPQDVSRRITELVAAESRYLKAQQDARAALTIDPDDAIEGPYEKWNAVVLSVSTAREAILSYQTCFYNCIEYCRTARDELIERVGIPEAIFSTIDLSSVSSVCNAMACYGVLEGAVKAFELTTDEAELWREKIEAVTTIEELWSLIYMAERESAERVYRKSYESEAWDYFSSARAAEIAAYLTTLSEDEVAAILPGLTQPPWVVAGSILLRILIDGGRTAQATTILAALSVSMQSRRALLRFVDPTSSRFDGEYRIRRLISMERLRDAFDFGPLAQISDPASGLNDVELVGRSVREILALITNNLSQLSSRQDIISALRPPMKDADAAETLVRVIRTPSTMTGVFRRIRETARDILLTPLIPEGQLDRAALRSLVDDIQSGEALTRVVAAFERRHADDRLEARHRESLNRFIREVDLIAQQVLSVDHALPSPHRRAFVEALSAGRQKLRAGGELGTVEWFESEVAIMLDGVHPSNDHATLVGGPEPIIARSWSGEDQEWALSYVDLPEFHSNDSPPTLLEVAASLLFWKARGRLPSTLDIVEALVEKQQFSYALKLATERNETEARELVISAASPLVQTIEDRGHEVRGRYRDVFGREPAEYDNFSAALTILDIEAAEEFVELWELEMLDVSSEQTDKSTEGGNSEKRRRLIEALQAAGYTANYERMSLAELEVNWSDVLDTHAPMRRHITSLISAFEKSASVHSIWSECLRRFAESGDDPRYWLEQETSENLSELARDVANKLSSWIINSPSFREEEQVALVDLTTWYLNFVLNRSLSIHEQNDKSAIQSSLDRMLEVAVTIEDARTPSECLLQLREAGEIERLMPPIRIDPGAKEESIDETAKFGTDASSMVPATSTDDVPNKVIPDTLLECLRTKKWSMFLSSSAEVLRGVDVEVGEGISRIVEAITPLVDSEPLPQSYIADKLPASAAWLSSSRDYALELAEADRMEAAYHVLTGAVASDSGQGLERAPAQGGSWSALLNRSSPFRKMLVSGLPSRTGRVMENLLRGTLGLQVSERLWDAATSQTEPQQYRTALLQLLGDYGIYDVIVRLAQRYDPAIAPRLAQLFELRAVAQNRPDLLPVAQSMAQHFSSDAKGVPFRTFIKALPSAAPLVKPRLIVAIDGSVQLRTSKQDMLHLDIPIVITPEGLVPAKLFAKLFPEDDVSFADGSRLKELSGSPIYFATDVSVSVRFGRSWYAADNIGRDSFRVRVEAKTVTDELVQGDAVCTVRSIDRSRGGGHRLDDDTLMELYPGVSNTPVEDKAFVGRIDELERLHQVLVSTRSPSPVLLTGMRRVGKTSLLYAFHQRCNISRNIGAVSVYQSLAERRVELVSTEHKVASVFFRAISHSLVRPNLPADDRNYALCSLIRERFAGDWRAARRAIQDCYDDESLASSIVALAGKLREWTKSESRFIFLVDEAEALVAPYQTGGVKRTELEQLLQSLREVSQSTSTIGLLLAGSNHINIFAREYKNAFFGSSQTIELEGLGDVTVSSRIINPRGVEQYIQFDPSAVEYAWKLCAGMPQFLWQVGAATAFQVRSGPVTRGDVRGAVTVLVGPERANLPFRPYEILEPIENMLSLELPRERDLLWMLLYRIAQASSLVVQNAAIPFVIDQALLALDDRTGWKRRVGALSDLKLVKMENPSTVRFEVPLFAEGFRAPKNWQEYNIRQQQVGI